MVRLCKDGKTQFVFEKSEEGPVYLVGDFNNWDERATPMKPAGPKGWRRDLNLGEGRYRFLYRVGDKWFVDADQPSAPNAWGSEFSVVSIDHGP